MSDFVIHCRSREEYYPDCMERNWCVPVLCGARGVLDGREIFYPPDRAQFGAPGGRPITCEACALLYFAEKSWTT